MLKVKLRECHVRIRAESATFMLAMKATSLADGTCAVGWRERDSLGRISAGRHQ